MAIATKRMSSSAETRAALLDAAGALMAERGTIDVPLADIAARSGLNAALVSYHFGGKEGLLLALAKRAADEALSDLDALMASDAPPMEKLRRHVAGVVYTFHRFPYLHALLAALLRDCAAESALEVSTFFARPLIEAQTKLLADTAAAGEADPHDPMLFHFAVVGACANIFAQRATLRAAFGVEEIDDALMRRFADYTANLIVNGLRRRAGD